MEIAGKNILVTGGASGIGRALAQACAERDAARLVVADIDREGADAVAKEFDATSAELDVRNPDAIAALIEDNAPFDLICSNAGIFVLGGCEVADDEWQAIWEINVMAHVWAARAALPGMLKRGSGYFLNTASAAGLLSQIGSAPYSVTKHAAVGFAEWLAITYGDRGIKVSVLCPQAVRTNMTAGTDDGGVAGVDGMLEPEAVAAAAVSGVREERFLILPHPEVATYVERKASDVERWLGGMRRLQKAFETL